jgi:translation initiation factor 3 subunit E
MAPYLDLHMMFPLLNFMAEKNGLYNDSELKVAQIELLKNTNMIDFAMDLSKKLNNSVPKGARVVALCAGRRLYLTGVLL